MDDQKVKQAVKDILLYIGENPDREGLVDTPDRVIRMYRELCTGYSANIKDIINDAVFHSDYSEMVIVKDIDFYSLCEHHLLPFFGKAHIGYIPNGKIIGLSKIPRILEAFSRRLQVQERLTIQIAETLNEYIQPLGVGVIMEGFHLCSIMRGVKKINAQMVTSAMLGVFRTDLKTRSEFLKLTGHPRQI